MKVLLISPPLENMIATNYPSAIEEESGCSPPLGLMYIAAYAEKNTDNKIEILDAVSEKMNYDRISETIHRKKPDVVGIQSLTFSIVDTLLLAKLVRNLSEDIKIVLGGPHVNIYPNETICRKEVDYLVLGEGEITFTDLLQNIDNIEKLKTTQGLVFKEGDKIINTGLRDPIDDLDAIPFPARHLTNYKNYYSLLAKRNPITTMMSSRGCPYQCTFCGRQHLGKRFRARSAKNVVDEIEECISMGIEEFLFYDDTFAVNRQRTLDICNEILERGLDIGWDIRTRVDNVDKEILLKLKKAGCERINYGVESGNAEMLKLIRKGITIEQAKEAFRLTKEIGIQTLAYFIIGLPGETKLQILDTIKFAKLLNPDYAHFSVLTPYPDTPLYENSLKNGVIKEDYWRDFAKNPNKQFVPRAWEEDLSRQELLDLLNYAYKDFYIDIGYILQQMLKIRSLNEFKKKTKAGLRLLSL